jgi:signal transduction histidine kinase
MLYEFLTANKAVLIDRCRSQLDGRASLNASTQEMQHGIPLLLDQLIDTLAAEQSAASGQAMKRPETGATASRHAGELSARGFGFEQVVRSYGDICETITDLAVEDAAPVHLGEFRTLNRCLDNAIADAVTEFAVRQQSPASDRDLQALDARLTGFVAEMSQHLHSANLAMAAIKAGKVGLNGVTGHILEVSLVAMRKLLEQPLAAGRETPHLATRHQLIPLAAFIGEVATFSAPEARARGCRFTVPEVDLRLGVDADRDMLFSVVSSLLENAFRFTQPQTEVTLSTRSVDEHILIDVGDHCGGLAPDILDKLFASPKHRRAERSGFRYGLAAFRRGIEENGGTLTVRNLPGTGCVFTIKLPRSHPSQPDVPAAGQSRL